MGNEAPRPWERLPGETDTAWESFQTYLGLGEQRTYEQTAKKLGKSVGTLQHWTKRNRWGERACEFDWYNWKLENPQGENSLLFQEGFSRGYAKGVRDGNRERVNLYMTDEEFELSRKLTAVPVKTYRGRKPRCSFLTWLEIQQRLEEEALAQRIINMGLGHLIGVNPETGEQDPEFIG